MRRGLLCVHCGVTFARAYQISAARAAKPQYCSKRCFSLALSRRASANLRERFNKLVDKSSADDCWSWRGRLDPSGYGRFDMNGKPHLAHRIAYFLNRPNDDQSLVVCHACDNPSCCNPQHLWLGTQADNISDMDRKNRRAPLPIKRGKEASKCKLDELDVFEIIASLKSNKELASIYGVSPAAIWNIRHGRAWSHITGISRS